MTTQAEAIAATTHWLVLAGYDRERHAAAGGPEAVAEWAWAWSQNGPSQEEIAATYRRMQAEAAGARTA